MPRFVPRQRKHKVLQREATGKIAPIDTNKAQLVPLTTIEKEEKKQKIRQELRASQTKISGKKQKRFEKYVENKLKKEESLDLLRKLSQDKFDTSRLQSSKNLGKRRYDDFTGNVVPKSMRKKKGSPPPQLVESDVESEDSFEESYTAAFESNNEREDVNKLKSLETAQAGSGLKQPLEIGENGLPLIQTRKKRRKISVKAISEQEIAWGGFDSEPCNEEEKGTEEGAAFDPSELRSSDDLSDEFDSTSDSELSAEEEDGSDPNASDTESGSSSQLEKNGNPKPRNSGFKAWATEQINKSLGYTASNPLSESENLNNTAPPSLLKSTTVISDLAINLADETLLTRKAYSVQVERSQSVRDSRLTLPIVGEEQKIMEAIYNHPVVIVWGATGSGKTTQLPQFLFEAGYGSPSSPTPGMIGVTQPRRVAAVSMADRVREELGQHGHKVSYQIRFESTTSSKTAIKFMTDGILLRELSQDLLLRKYSVIVIDEAHERSVNTDVLIGMLSRVVPMRADMSKSSDEIKPLKLVIMSATLRTSDFLNDKLFRISRPPIVQAEGRQYPVVVHFSRATQRDYLEETVRKVHKGHRKLPPGGILVFLTGQNEIRAVMDRLEKLISPKQAASSGPRVQFSSTQTPFEVDDLELGGFEEESGFMSDPDILTSDQEEDEEFDVRQLPDDSLQPPSKITSAAQILPLYSQLPTKEQLRVFGPVPAGARLIVLATNVAETSLTIPGIRYVFDCGRSKERIYNETTAVQSFEIDWISKASAEQRKGRAGRTGPGHCYRLYSSAVYERDFPEHGDPEILRIPSESVVLQLKGFHFPGKIANFPFPTPPSTDSLAKAEKLLTNLGALTGTGEITALGRDLSVYPLAPRLGKMLITSLQRGCLSQVLALVAGISVGDVFIPENHLDLDAIGRQDDEVYTQKDYERDEEREQRKKAFGRAQAIFCKGDKMSDAVKLLTAISMHSQSSGQMFCEDNFLRAKAMREVEQLRGQLASIVRANNPAMADLIKSELRVGSSKDLKLLKEIVGAGFIDQVAIRADLSPNPPDMPRKPKRTIDIPYLPLLPLTDGPSSVLEDRAVYLHPSSVLANLNPKELPQYIVYSHLQRAQSALIGSGQVAKTRMFPLTAIDGTQLVELARDTPLLRHGKPVGQVKVLGGAPKRQECWVVPELGGGNGVIGWPLPPVKVVQVQDLKRGWVVESFLA